MTVSLEAVWAELAAQHYEPHPRRYPRPGDLARALDPATRTSPALELIDDELVALADHTNPADALAIFIPPGEGKSQRVSRRYPEWLLAHDPALRIAIVSYEQEMATRWGRQILRDLKQADPGIIDVQVMADSSAAGRWDTPRGGGIYCVGVGGALTGRPVDVLLPVLLIDDPVKDREAAESATYRARAWDWWESVALTRLAPGGVVALIQTRWHESDLSGQILSKPSPLRWRVLSIPAIAEDHDPLGREPGEELRSVRERGPGHFAKIRAGISSYVFSGLYQQSPTAAEGNFFRRAAFRYWRCPVGQPDPAALLAMGSMAGVWLELEGGRVDLADPAVWRFATVDVAASTKTASDFTVCAVWAISREGDLILLDRARGHAEMSDHFAMVKPLRDRWRFDVAYIERSFYSKTLVTDAREAGVPVAEVVADTDKITRAIPAAGRVHAGKVWFPADAPWLEEWENEVASFPAGAHDDQVDVMAYAARIASAHWTPAPPPSRPPQVPADMREIQRAFDAATGNGYGGPEKSIMDIPLG